MERWTRRTEALFDGLLGPGEGERVLNLLAGIFEDVLGLFGAGDQGHIAVIFKLHDIRDLEFMFVTVFVH